MTTNDTNQQDFSIQFAQTKDIKRELVIMSEYLHCLRHLMFKNLDSQINNGANLVAENG